MAEGRPFEGLKQEKKGQVGYWYDTDRQTGKMVTFGRWTVSSEKPSQESRQKHAAWLVSQDREKVIDSLAVAEGYEYDAQNNTLTIELKEGFGFEEGQALEDWLSKLVSCAGLQAVRHGNKLIEGDDKGETVKGERVKDGLKLWTDKMDETGKVTRRHRNETACIVTEFADYLGNPPLLALPRQHFILWKDHLTTVSKGKAASWHNKRVRLPKLVLNWLRENHSALLPDGLADWMDMLKLVTENPADINDEPMPVAEFKKLLSVATDEEKAFLYLSANCGLDGGDIVRLKWEHLNLNAEAPHFSMVRHKVLWRVRKPNSVKRATPLAKATVEAVRELRKSNKGDYVFYSDHGTPWSSKVICDTVNSLKARAGLAESPYSFKHLRNIRSNVGDDIDMPTQRIHGFLGHSVPTEAKSYGVGSRKKVCQYQTLVSEMEKR